MTNSIKFTVPGKPQGKGRPRFARHGKFVNTWTPEQTVIYENLIVLEFRKAAPSHEPFIGMVEINWVAYISVPQSASKKQKEMMLFGQAAPLVKPDADNILKVIMDALNGIAYKDDKQVVQGRFTKRFAEIPRLEIEVKEI